MSQALSTTQALKPELQAKVAASRALLAKAVADFGAQPGDIVYSNSLGAEAIVLTDLLWGAEGFPTVEIFSIDTGRLHEDTYSVLERVQRRYGKRIKLYYPQTEQVEQYVSQNGINGFYGSPEQRQGCCQIRKIEPFRRAIAGRKAWITGVRREQSATRALGEPVEWDAANNLHKISPLLDWTQKDVWDYIHALKLPYNQLHDRGFPSIGCAPCTRAVEPGQDSRSGRWWWENTESRECGLHPRIRIVAQHVPASGASARITDSASARVTDGASVRAADSAGAQAVA